MSRLDKAMCAGSTFPFRSVVASLWRRKPEASRTLRDEPGRESRPGEARARPSLRGRTITVLSYEDFF